jgi:hypothetical protein
MQMKEGGWKERGRLKGKRRLEVKREAGRKEGGWKERGRLKGKSETEGKEGG